MVHYCNELLAAFKINNRAKISKWMIELEEENNKELSLAKKYSIKYLLSLHGMIAREIGKIKSNLNNAEKCSGFVNRILISLENVVDQREIRDKLIKEVMHPMFKSWGFKKKKRAFVKQGKYFKKVNIFTSQFCDYYDVKFIFEVEIKGPGVSYEAHRVNNKWFELTQDKNLETVKAEIEAHLLKDIKPFLDQFQ